MFVLGLKDGTIEAIDLYTLSNQGAYGEHGPTTIGLAGHKSLPLYNHVKASRFTYDVVYTNTMRAGAYRGMVLRKVSLRLNPLLMNWLMN